MSMISYCCPLARKYNTICERKEISLCSKNGMTIRNGSSTLQTHPKKSRPTSALQDATNWDFLEIGQDPCVNPPSVNNSTTIDREGATGVLESIREICWGSEWLGKAA